MVCRLRRDILAPSPVVNSACVARDSFDPSIGEILYVFGSFDVKSTFTCYTLCS